MTGIERHYDVLTHLRENPDSTAEISKEVISDVSNVLDFLDTVILPPAGHSIMFELIKTYRLLPNDALIAATCKYYGIKKIATFDEDFKRVDFLKVVEV